MSKISEKHVNLRLKGDKMLRLVDSKLKRYKLLKVESKVIDATNFSEFKVNLIKELRPEETIILNLENVNFVDSSGLGALISGLKAIGNPELLILCGLNEQVVNLLELTCLNKVFQTRKDYQEALEEIGPAR